VIDATLRLLCSHGDNLALVVIQSGDKDSRRMLGFSNFGRRVGEIGPCTY
jgi:hypothetical protein